MSITLCAPACVGADTPEDILAEPWTDKAPHFTPVAAGDDDEGGDDDDDDDDDDDEDEDGFDDDDLGLDDDGLSPTELEDFDENDFDDDFDDDFEEEPEEEEEDDGFTTEPPVTDDEEEIEDFDEAAFRELPTSKSAPGRKPDGGEAVEAEEEE